MIIPFFGEEVAYGLATMIRTCDSSLRVRVAGPRRPYTRTRYQHRLMGVASSLRVMVSVRVKAKDGRLAVLIPLMGGLLLMGKAAHWDILAMAEWADPEGTPRVITSTLAFLTRLPSQK